MLLRDATQADADALSALAIETYTDAFGHSMTEADLAAHLVAHLTPSHFAHDLSRDVILVADEGGQLVGYVQFGQADDADGVASLLPRNGDQTLRRLYVRADVQGQGIGTRLLQAALAHPRLQAARRVFLDVWEKNTGARRLYERHGFHVIGAHRFAVASGAETDDDLVMVRVAPC